MAGSAHGPLTGGAAAGLRIVALGASAGGLEPLVQLLAQVPAGSGLAWIVAQHLDPDRPSLLAGLLQRATTMPVQEARQAMLIAPDHVYVMPPHAELTVANGRLRLAEPSQPRGQRLLIDRLFESLAQAQGADAVGVLLSGMGADGSLGLQAIRARGGLTLAQRPGSAQFDAMPRHAIAAGGVAIVALPAEMPAHILASAAGTSAPPLAAAPLGGEVSAGEVAAGEVPVDEVPEAGALQTIVALLQAHTGHDLAHHKPSSLLRRISRRMAVHGLATLPAYADLLRANPQALDLLFNELLIGVTGFFRDPEAWQVLADTVLPALLARRDASGGPLRAWVAGCSTGEEAYTLAMLLTEALDAAPAGSVGGGMLQVFATDLSADAIAAARSGLYPAAIAQAMTPQRLARFFTAQGGHWRISAALRERVLFAEHDLIRDPPFTRLDLLSCRNLLIYFDSTLQQRLVPLFHDCLRPGGVLMLGASETVGRAQALFRPVQPRARLYWRSDQGAAAAAISFTAPRRPAWPAAMQENPLPTPTNTTNHLQSLVDQLLLQQHAPAAVLVNPQGDILYINGHTGRYLEPAAGKANWNIHAMARPGIRAQLAVALRSALQATAAVQLRGLRLDDGAAAGVDISVQAVAQPPALQGTVLIVFRDAARRTAHGRKAGAGDTVSGDELLRAHQEILALRDEMQAAQLALHTTNEELQAANEELQSANEELTTSKEEAQSMNEELQTINGELQTRLDDLALAQSDMQNLLNSTAIATLFLDNVLNVRRFTPQISRIVPLREGDIGRPLSDLATTLVYPGLHADVMETLRTLEVTEKEIATTDGLWFAVRIMPYRTLANVVQGAVITFVDITVAKELESRLRKA